MKMTDTFFTFTETSEHNDGASGTMSCCSLVQRLGQMLTVAIVVLALSLASATTAWAQGYSISANVDDGHAAAAFDRNNDTGWSTGSVSETNPATLTITSTTPASFNFLAIVWKSDCHDLSYKIEYSTNTDISSPGWTEAVSVSNHTPSASLGYTDLLPLGKQVTGVRRVRITITNAPASGATINEFFIDNATLSLQTATNSTLVGVNNSVKVVPVLHVAETDLPLDVTYVDFSTDDTSSTYSTFDKSTGNFTGKKGGSVTISAKMKDYKGNVQTAASPEASITLSIIAIDASTSKGQVYRLIDGNTETKWNTGSLAGKGAQWITFDLSQEQKFDIIGIYWGNNTAKIVKIYGSNTGTADSDWTFLVRTASNYDPANRLEGYPMAKQESYRYLKFEFSEPNKEANGYTICDIYLDNIKKLRAISVSSRVGDPEPVKEGADELMIGETKEMRLYADGEHLSNIEVWTSNQVGWATGATSVATVSSRNVTGVSEGTVTMTATLRAYGYTDPSTTKRTSRPSLTATITYTVKDYHVPGRTYVHTKGAGDPVNLHPAVADWAKWQTVASTVDTEYLTSATDSRIEDTDGIRQKTHVAEHTIYAMPGETYYLIPYSDFSTSKQYEDKFVRWYDYRTDKKHPWLQINLNAEHYAAQSKPQYEDKPYIDSEWGMMAGELFGFADVKVGETTYTARAVGRSVKLQIPSTADFRDKPIIIAMDAAQDPSFDDMLREDGKMYEPLINFRHIFYVYDARAHVSDYSNSEADNIAFTQARKRHITARADDNFHVRLNYILPAGKYASGMLYEENNNAGGSYAGELDSTVKTHGTIKRVGPCYVKTFDAHGNEVFISGTTNSIFWLGNASSTFEATAGWHSFYRTLSCHAADAKPGTYTVRIYAGDTSGNPVYVRGTTDVPLIVQEYEVTFATPDKASFLPDELGLLDDEKAANADHSHTYANQQFDYLDSHYEKLATVDFDDPVKYPIATAETDAVRYVDHSTMAFKWPVPWEDSNYAFGYAVRHDYNMYMLTTHTDITPYHSGATRMWTKDKNFPGSKYGSVNRDGLFDRKFYENQGEDLGYFYYVNAAGDPGVMARIKIDNLCLGSTLYVTGWVAECSSTVEKANLIFNFNVVLKDGRTVTLHSYTTGYVPSDPSSDSAGSTQYQKDQKHVGRWYKAYYSFVPNTQGIMIDPELIDHYELLLENNCVSSNGADYAIDDIRVWVSKPDINARQMTPICNIDTDPDIKVSTPFENLVANMGLAPAETAAEGDAYVCYYTLLDQEKYEAAFNDEPDPDKKAQAALNASVISYKYDPTGPAGQKFGLLTFNTHYESNKAWPLGTSAVETMRETIDGVPHLVFNTTPSATTIVPGKEYTIALWAPGCTYADSQEPTSEFYASEANVLKAVNFSIGDPCSKVSTFTVESAGVIKINGEIVSSKDHLTVCKNQYPVIQIDVQGLVPVDPDNYDPSDPAKSETKMTVVEKGAPYDWFFGSYADYQAAHYEEGGIMLFTLDDAIHCYREYYNGEHEGDDDINKAVPHTDDDPEHVDASNQPIHFTQKMLDYLKELATTPVAALSGRPALLLYKRSCPITPRIVNGVVEYRVTAVPIERSKYWVDYGGQLVELGPDKVIVCTQPTEIHINVDETGPVLLHGFAHDETYPATMDDVPLRIGYDQLRLVSQPLDELQKVIAGTVTEQNMIDNACVLSVPVRSAQSTTAEVEQLVRNGDIVVYLYETNDPEYMMLEPSAQPIVPYPTEQADDNTLLPQIGLFLQLQGATSNAEITADKDFCRFVFRDDFHFKEGYYYRFRFDYGQDYPADYTGERAKCDGQSIMTLKVVPKYQMWVGETSTDFNNDHNWRRISSDELHHVFTGDGDPLRPKLTDGYNGPTNTTALQNRATGYANRQSYVPMDFTDIIIPDTDHFPRLYHRSTNDKWITYFEDGKNYSWLWPEGRLDGEEALNNTATVDIEYDMAAWNRTNDLGTIRGVNCRPWYANTCEHVTFLPGAEIYGQQHLKYQRAWVELEVDPDRWYTLTSPLQKIVSGDMYAPTLGARQLTEHFQPIYFNPMLNDRFRPAVYQRAWDHSDMARIFRMDHDGMYGDDKNIDDAYVTGTWSHVYNDNEEIFTDGRGFSIKADVSRNPDASSISRVLFRLPKDDDQYYYHSLVDYDKNGQNAANADPTRNPDERNYGDRAELDRGTPVALTTDMRIDGQPVAGPTVPAFGRLNDVSGTITVTTENAGQYFLVGNPFMASLDMQKFFDANPGLQRKFWIVTANRQETAIMDGANTIATDGTTTVAPLQAFFVEATDAAAKRLELTYTKEMQKNFPVYTINVDGSDVPGTANPNVRPGDVNDPRPGLQMPARRSGAALDGQLRILLSDPSEQESRSDHSPRLVSTAVVALAPSASADYRADEDAILLLDSNLDTQSALYTVAGETAVSINRLERVDIVPLGIVCDNDELSKKMLTLSFDGADAFPQPLYLYDAQSGETTAITDDLSLSVPAASAGQYFITTGIDQIEDNAVAAGPMYNLKGIRVANTRNEQIVIQGARKSVVK